MRSKLRRTDVFELGTIDQVETFCNYLLRLKRVAPASLRFMVALTTKREVEMHKSAHGENGFTFDGEFLDMKRLIGEAPPEIILAEKPKPHVPPRDKGKRRAMALDEYREGRGVGPFK